MNQDQSDIDKKINNLPMNTKLLVGILAVAILVGGAFVFKAVDQSGWMMEYRIKKVFGI